MNASEVIRMRQQVAIVKGRDGNVQKAYGVTGLCGKQPGCCFDCSDTAVGCAGAAAGDLVYQGGVFFGCKKPTVVAMTKQAPVVCPPFVETNTLIRGNGLTATPCPCSDVCPPAITAMTKQPAAICPAVVLDTPLE